MGRKSRQKAAARSSLSSTDSTSQSRNALLTWQTALAVGALVAASLVGVALVSGQPAVPESQVTVAAGELRQGKPAPDFGAQTFDGVHVRLSDLRGRAVLVNFFASWCTECRAEIPAIQSAYRHNHDRGFDVLGVNTLESGDGRSFLQDLGGTFPAVRDGGRPGQAGPIASAYGVSTGLPLSVFVGRGGNVDAVYPGRIDATVLASEISRLLGAR